MTRLTVVFLCGIVVGLNQFLAAAATETWGWIMPSDVATCALLPAGLHNGGWVEEPPRQNARKKMLSDFCKPEQPTPAAVFGLDKAREVLHAINAFEYEFIPAQPSPMGLSVGVDGGNAEAGVAYDALLDEQMNALPLAEEAPNEEEPAEVGVEDCVFALDPVEEKNRMYSLLEGGPTSYVLLIKAIEKDQGAYLSSYVVTPLHYAIARRNIVAAFILLWYGLPWRAYNQRGTSVRVCARVIGDKNFCLLAESIDGLYARFAEKSDYTLEQVRAYLREFFLDFEVEKIFAQEGVADIVHEWFSLAGQFPKPPRYQGPRSARWRGRASCRDGGVMKGGYQNIPWVENYQCPIALRSNAFKRRVHLNLDK
jgi:hypothetical protein